MPSIQEEIASPKSKSPGSLLIPCRITAKDVAAMDYWLNEAPMADPSRQNAICFALKRLLRDGVEIMLRETSSGRVEAVIDGSTGLALPQDLVAWWKRVLAGHRATPVSVLVEMPQDLLSPHLLASLQEQEKRLHSQARASGRLQANAA